tara:strand:- start:39 stop:395 length:357 start_codon:yes stop_codon:yes gene_type:complete
MIKLKDILNEALNIYSVDVVIVSDKEANITDVFDGIRAIRRVTIVNPNTPEDREEKNRQRTDGKEVHTATIKFVAGQDPKQDLEFFKTTMLQSDKGDPNKRIPGLRHVVFKPESLTKI